MDHQSFAQGMSVYSALRHEHGASDNYDFAAVDGTLVEVIHTLDQDPSELQEHVRTRFGFDPAPSVADCVSCNNDGGMVFVLDDAGGATSESELRRLAADDIVGTAEKSPFVERLAVPKSLVDELGSEENVRKRLFNAATLLSAHHLGSLYSFRVVGEVNDDGSVDLTAGERVFRATVITDSSTERKWIENMAKSVVEMHNDSRIEREAGASRGEVRC